MTSFILNKHFSFVLIQNREWYGYHFPELVKIIPDNHMYAKVVKIVKNRKELTDELLEQLEECVMDSAKAKAIIDASKSSMGLIFLCFFKPVLFDQKPKILIN